MGRTKNIITASLPSHPTPKLQNFSPWKSRSSTIWKDSTKSTMLPPESRTPFYQNGGKPPEYCLLTGKYFKNGPLLLSNRHQKFQASLKVRLHILLKHYKIKSFRRVHHQVIRQSHSLFVQNNFPLTSSSQALQYNVNFGFLFHPPYKSVNHVDKGKKNAQCALLLDRHVQPKLKFR